LERLVAIGGYKRGLPRGECPTSSGRTHQEGGTILNTCGGKRVFVVTENRKGRVASITLGEEGSHRKE